jgi:hypothetical protein
VASYAIPPASFAASRRVRHTQLRLRMIRGEWADDYAEYRLQRIGTVRASAWGPPETLDCPMRDLPRSVSVLHIEPMDVRHLADDAAAEEVRTRLGYMGAQEVLGEAQFLTEALNECAIKLEVLDDGRMSLRQVTPDLLEGIAADGRPGVPVVLWEWILRDVDGRTQYVRDYWDIRDPLAPVREIRAADDQVIERLEWPEVHTRADGRAVLPYSLRHSIAAPLSLWNPEYRRETVGGTFRLAVHSDMIDHSITNAAFKQKYGVNIQPMGASTMDAGGQPVQSVPGDPASILLFETDSNAPPGAQAILDQFDESAPITEMQDVLERRRGQLASMWGVNASDLVRSSPNPTSGVALSLSRAGIREVQRNRSPIYRPHDERLCAMLAVAMNRTDGGTRPESGYSVRYQLLPLSQGEQDQRTRETLEMHRLGLFSKAEARARITGEDIEQAEAKISRIISTAPQTPEEGTQ